MGNGDNIQKFCVYTVDSIVWKTKLKYLKNYTPHDKVNT
jgi:hypothetical protein